MPEVDALTEVDGLQEADLVDARFTSRESSLAILFDLRTSLQFRMANTAVLAMRDIQRFTWTCDEFTGRQRVAHYVMSSKPEVTGGFLSFELVCLRGWRMTAVSASAEFFVGDVPHLPEAPPNFVEDTERAIAEGMPAWGSTFTPDWATFLDPVPS